MQMQSTESQLDHATFSKVKFAVRSASLATLWRTSKHLSSRPAVHPAQQARTKAHRRGLSLDIGKARRCPQTQVSVVPLPILDTAPSPVAPIAASRDIELDNEPMLHRPIPRRPLLRCVIPDAEDAQPRRPQRPKTISLEELVSRFSMSPVDMPAPFVLPNEEAFSRPIPDVPTDEFDSIELTPATSSAGSSSNSESAESSVGPSTPIDNTRETLVPVGMKRKTADLDELLDYKKPAKHSRMEWTSYQLPMTHDNRF